MDVRDTVSFVEILALGANIIGLIVLYQLKRITDIQVQSIIESKKTDRQKELLRLAVSRNIRSISNRTVVHMILGGFNIWMMFRENPGTWFVLALNSGLLFIIVFSIVMSLRDIDCERRMSRLLEDESV